MSDNATDRKIQTTCFIPPAIKLNKYLFLAPISDFLSLIMLTFELESNKAQGAPYLDSPSIGWDYYYRSGRGEQNRYRGKRLLYFESEYRRDISQKGFWGFVLFANIHTVSEYAGNTFVYRHPAAGTGLRIKFNKISPTNISV
jgi:hypothetical protein